MGTPAGSTPCLLTPKPGPANRFTAKAGQLSLVVKQIKGHTDLDCVNSKVSDITDFDNQVAVTHACTSSSFGFELKSGKKYFVSLTFVQLDSPFTAKGTLNESCGQVVDTIDATNLFPGYFIEVE